MGWLRKGTAHPEIEKTIENLKIGEASAVVKTPRGFHLITLVDKRDGEKMAYLSIKDKIRQAFVSMKMTEYLKQLQQKYKIDWRILNREKAVQNDKT